jgi:hypothetical protein
MKTKLKDYQPRRIRLVSVTLVLMVLVALFPACTKTRVIGRWQKVTTQACAITYPAKLEFFGDGTYVGELPNWNGGRYSIIDGNRIKLDTLTGPGVYEIELSRDRLTFKNDSGCIFQYKRL